jgi:hypothetical protein
MSDNDKKVLNAIINPNTPFEEENKDQISPSSINFDNLKYK